MVWIPTAVLGDDKARSLSHGWHLEDARAQRTHAGGYPGITLAVGFLDAVKLPHTTRDCSRHEPARHRPQSCDSPGQIWVGRLAPQGAARVLVGSESLHRHYWSSISNFSFSVAASA